MAKFVVCEKDFDVDEAREQFDGEFEGDFDYAEETEGGPQCVGCAGARINSDINAGRVIMMMNGDEDYDEDHVEKYL